MRDPSACRHCGVSQREHCSRWMPLPVGWHQWTEPTWEQRREAIIHNAQARPAAVAAVDGPAHPQAPTGSPVTLRRMLAAAYRRGIVLRFDRANTMPWRTWVAESSTLDIEVTWSRFMSQYQVEFKTRHRDVEIVLSEDVTIDRIAAALALCGWEVPGA